MPCVEHGILGAFLQRDVGEPYLSILWSLLKWSGHGLYSGWRQCVFMALAAWVNVSSLFLVIYCLCQVGKGSNNKLNFLATIMQQSGEMRKFLIETWNSSGLLTCSVTEYLPSFTSWPAEYSTYVSLLLLFKLASHLL